MYRSAGHFSTSLHATSTSSRRNIFSLTVPAWTPVTRQTMRMFYVVLYIHAAAAMVTALHATRLQHVPVSDVVVCSLHSALAHTHNNCAALALRHAIGYGQSCRMMMRTRDCLLSHAHDLTWRSGVMLAAVVIAMAFIVMISVCIALV